MMPESGRTGSAIAGHRFDLCLLGNLQRVIYLDAQVSDRASQLGMARQQLNGSSEMLDSNSRTKHGIAIHKDKKMRI